MNSRVSQMGVTVKAGEVYGIRLNILLACTLMFISCISSSRPLALRALGIDCKTESFGSYRVLLF